MPDNTNGDASSSRSIACNDVNLSSLPREYLEAYPYPAFVLVSSAPNPAPRVGEPGTSEIPVGTVWSTTPSANPQPYTPVWTNSKWDSLAEQKSLVDCMSFGDLQRLATWLSGGHQATLPDDHLGLVFESPDDAEDQLPADCGNPSLVCDFICKDQTVEYELTKTSIDVKGIWADGHGYHTLVIVTTVPRNDLRPRRRTAVESAASTSASSSTTIVPQVPKVPSGDDHDDSAMAAEDTPRESNNKLPHPPHRPPGDVQMTDKGAWSPGQSLYYMRDGTVMRPLPPSRKLSDGLPRDVNLLFEQTDWSKTPLGPRDKWPKDLLCTIGFMRSIPISSALWWGKEFTLLYNQHFADQWHKHPAMFGQSGKASWAEMSGSLRTLTDTAIRGTAVFKEDDFFLVRNIDKGTAFESYRCQMWIPVPHRDGSISGIIHTIYDTTARVLSERRSHILRELEERTVEMRTIDDYHVGVLDTLRNNAKDAPFAMLYSVETLNSYPAPHPSDSHANPSRHRPSTAQWSDPARRARLRYVGGVGVPSNHPSAPAERTVMVPPEGDPPHVVLAEAFSDPALQKLDTPSSSSQVSSSIRSSSTHSVHQTIKAEMTDDAQWPVVLALHSRHPVLVENCGDFLKDFTVRVWDELPTSAIIIPIARSSDKDLPVTVLILGLSCRLPFDESYEAFIHLMQSQMATHLAAVRSYRADKERIEELGSLDRENTRLFSNVAHELFARLTPISGPIDDAIVDMKPGPQRDGLIMARRNVRRWSRLVGMLRDSSSLEAGRLKGSFQLVNLGIVTRDIATMFRKASDKRNLRYSVDCDLSNVEVYVDREQWERILFTLIGNALNYTPEGSLDVSLKYTDTEAILTVTDTGVGIPCSELKLIGERFYRAKCAHLTHDGAGVSLSWAKKLIDMHQGTLEMESKTKEEADDGSHGSTFRVRIPLGSAHLLPGSIRSIPDKDGVRIDGGVSDWENEIEELLEQRAGNDLPPPMSPTSPTAPKSLLFRPPKSPKSPKSPLRIRVPASLSPKSANDALQPVTPTEKTRSSPDDKESPRARGIDRSTLWFDAEDVIMIVDDLYDTRRYLRSILEPFCKVVEARDGEEALQMYEQTNPDLIISELTLPRLNGFELLDRLRSGTREQSVVPFLMLTGVDDSRPDDALSADDFLSKPFNARELVARAHLQLQLGKKRRTLEKLFEQRTAELRVVTERSPVAIFRCTPDGYVSYANQQWYKMSGYPDGSPITNWGDYISENDQARVRAVWEEFIATGAPTASAEWQWTNGRWAAAAVIRLDDKGVGKPLGSIGSVVDITDRKLHEHLQRQRVHEAEQRRAEAEEAKHQQELLIDITSHEIRNPISSLMQYCASLVKSNLVVLYEQFQKALASDNSFKPTKQLLTTIAEDLEALDSIYQCGLTQERISNDVLSLGKIQLDMLQMFDTDSNVRKEAQKIISIFQNEARMKRIEVSLSVSPAFERLGLQSIKTDHVRLGQVITNLLSNAIRFTANSPVRRIQLSLDVGLDPPDDGSCSKPSTRTTESLPIAEDTPLFLYVTVSDTGPGLTPDELEMLFQRFSQASPKTHSMYGGSGLGLFVCRKLTERMGGRIGVTSEPGQGCQFRFFICVKAGAKRHLVLSTQSDGHEVKYNREHLVRSGTHILVVEDNLINRTVLMRQLKHFGLKADFACDGLEALEKVRRAMKPTVKPRMPRLNSDSSEDGVDRPYDCILMDLEMPIMDGYTSARHIRDDEAAGRLSPSSIIALTGNARQAQIESVMADFDSVIIKPYRLDDLLWTIENLIRQRRGEGPDDS